MNIKTDDLSFPEPRQAIKLHILLIQADELIRHAIGHFLRAALGHEVIECSSEKEALDILKIDDIQVILVDFPFREMSSSELIQRIFVQSNQVDTAIVLMTQEKDIEEAISALSYGAYDYLEKPIDVIKLSSVLDRVGRDYLNRILLIRLSSQSEDDTGAAILPPAIWQDSSLRWMYLQIPDYGSVGIFSSGLQEVVDYALRFHHDRSVPVLIEGETGTGKEIIARLVHHGSGKSDSPFICINCPSIANGLFESELFGYEAGAFTGAKRTGNIGKLELAQQGTLFLDEIGDLPFDLQPKLLRVLQEREMFRVGGARKVSLNVRIIAATNKNLALMVDEGRFRKDLYYRLNLGRIHIPPLRERPESIIPLAQMFLTQHAAQKRRRFRNIDRSARNILEAYSWPGNIRELQNAMERVVLLYDDETVHTQHLSFLAYEHVESEQSVAPVLRPGQYTLPPDRLNLKLLEDDIVWTALKKFNGNKSDAAKYLGLTRSALFRRVEKLLQRR